MTRVAHISDVHLLESRHRSRAARDKLRLSILSLGRTLDADDVRRRFVSALRRARTADHLVISGDLTEDGAPAQFEVLAEVLAESPWSPEQVTIVPGNHDAYHRPDAWLMALEGPMADYRRTSAPGAVAELPAVTIVAVATTIDQHWMRAAGRVGHAQRARIADVVSLAQRRGHPAIVAMHHPPMPWGLRLGFIEGLLDVDDVSALLQNHKNAYVLAGHIHRAGDHRFRGELEPRLFVADAVADHPSPVRFYDTCAGAMTPGRLRGFARKLGETNLDPVNL